MAWSKLKNENKSIPNNAVAKNVIKNLIENWAVFFIRIFLCFKHNKYVRNQWLLKKNVGVKKGVN